MSEENENHESPIERAMRQAIAPTEAELAAEKKRRLEAVAALHRKYNAFLPHLKDAQRSLREAAAIGCGGPPFSKAQEKIAILIEECETQLVRSPGI